MIKNHPEIKALQKLYDDHKIAITVSESDFQDNKYYYPAVEFSIAGNTFNLFVEDEYEDFKINNPLLSLSLVLRELEIYNEENDFLNWCKSQMLDASNTSVLNYYKTLSTIYNEIKSILGKIENPISDWDYEMGSGVISYLRNKK